MCDARRVHQSLCSGDLASIIFIDIGEQVIDIGEQVKNKTIIINTIAATAAFIFASLGCGQAANSNNSTANTSNSNVVAGQVSNTNSAPAPAATSDPPAATSTGSLATPSDAYRTAHDLRKRKDFEGLKKVMSPDILEFLTMMGEEEKKSLDDMLKEMCNKPQAERAEVRNEKIAGNTATVEYLTETGSWKTMDFEKIGGEWRLGLPGKDSLTIEGGNKQK
jgi:hypothetical protein